MAIFRCLGMYAKAIRSLYYFCLVEDYLSRKLSILASKGIFSPMYGGHNFNCPTHFLYADDVIIFGKATRSNINVLTFLFSEYGLLSGQLVNWEKSNMFLGKGVASHHASSLHVRSSMKAGSFSYVYLGVPIFISALKA